MVVAFYTLGPKNLQGIILIFDHKTDYCVQETLVNYVVLVSFTLITLSLYMFKRGDHPDLIFGMRLWITKAGCTWLKFKGLSLSHTYTQLAHLATLPTFSIRFVEKK